jgi:hypothetical protein
MEEACEWDSVETTQEKLVTALLNDGFQISAKQ